MSATEFHRLANILPLTSEEDFKSFKEDIRKHGLHEPIWTYEGKVLDGRHRKRACNELGIDCPEREYTGDDPPAFVWSANGHRRHLSPSQKAIAAAKLREEYDKMAKERQKRKSKSVPVTVPEQNKGDSRDLAGKAVGVSGTLVDRATKVISKGVPELAKAVEEGRMCVTRAAAIADKSPESQRYAAESARPLAGAYHRPREESPKMNGKPPKHEPPTPTDRQRDNATNYTQDAINCLRKIGRDNPLRADAFKRVRKWMKDNP